MKIGKYTRLSVIGYRLSAKTENRKPSIDSRKPGKAFTLVELLIATTIFAVVSVAIYSTFSSGMSVWRRAGKLNMEEMKNLIKIEKINKELRQAVVFKKQSKGFLGFKQQLRFMAIIDSEISFVKYRFEENKKMLLREVRKAKDLRMAAEKNEKLETAFVPYLDNVSDLSISYFFFDTIKGAYQWEQNYQEMGMPLAVKLDIIIGNEAYATTVFIPSA